jgi:multisubunit Na+/H+ antiporter MnhF subunit
MHEAVFYAAVLWMTGLLGVSVFLVVRARSSLSRILALDMLILILIAELVLFAAATSSSYYLDAALALSLLAIAATIAASRYHAEDEPFT